jgi:PAS domain S-box-containing protein
LLGAALALITIVGVYLGWDAIAIMLGFERKPAALSRAIVLDIAVVAAFLTLLAASGAFLWQQHQNKKVLAQREKESAKILTATQLRLSEAQLVEEQTQEQRKKLQERMLSLELTNQGLSDELNKRKRSEQALSQQRFALESSKSVLEVHVQARTFDLERLQRRNELILNSAAEGICGLDHEGKTTFANPAVARITGWPIEEIIGKGAREIFSLSQENGAALPETPGVSEQLFKRRDGSQVIVEIVRSPIQEAGTVTGTVLIFKDVTDRRKVEQSLARKAEELTRSNAELEEFAFVASHDLQEPLRKIQAFGDRLKSTCVNLPPQAIDYLERMQSASARMRNLIDDLLAFSRATRDSQPFAKLDLTQLTREVLGDLEMRIEKTGAQIDLRDLPSIEADAMQMRQLMLNLIGNALKFQPAGTIPRITISAEIRTSAGHEPLAEIRVIDNGIGFDQKYAEKIFAVFQRLHGKTEFEGTGVGLAVCRRITDRHHGTIAAQSVAGKGATFVVTLPLKQPKQATAL